MQSIADVLEGEGKRLQALAERCFSLAKDIRGTASITLNTNERHANGTHSMPTLLGEYGGMTQRQAILSALRQHVPQTTRELFNRLSAGGMQLKKPTYITALLPRMRDLVTRDEKGRVCLIEGVTA